MLRSSVLLLVFAGVALATKGWDTHLPLSADQMHCMKNNGYTFATFRCYHSYGGIDKNGVHNLATAAKAGIHADAYMFPCSGSGRGKSAKQQVNEVVGMLKDNKSKFGRLWLDIEANPSHDCQWYKSNRDANCKFLGELIHEIEHHGLKAGIYTSKWVWDSYFSPSCTVGSHLPLWYAHYQKPEQTNFHDFHPFGGWTHPYAKQFSSSHAPCGPTIDSDWHP